MSPLVDIIIKIDDHSQTQKSKLWENHNSDCGNIWHILIPIGGLWTEFRQRCYMHFINTTFSQKK